jgi:hypothetical protein
MFRGRKREFFVREPDAGDPQVRFDERGVETDLAAMWVKRQSIGTVSPTARPAAPLLDSPLKILRPHPVRCTGL